MANLVTTYSNQGRWDEAEKLCVDVMNARKAKLGSDHPDTLTSIATLSLMYLTQRRSGEAQKLQVHVTNMLQADYGSNYTDSSTKPKAEQSETLTILKDDLTLSTCENQEWLDDAKKLEVEVVNARKTKLKPDDQDGHTIQRNTYASQGMWEEVGPSLYCTPQPIDNPQPETKQQDQTQLEGLILIYPSP